MAPKKGARAKAVKKFAADAPWRAATGERPIPKISHGVVFAVREGPNFTYALSVMKAVMRFTARAFDNRRDFTLLSYLLSCIEFKPRETKPYVLFVQHPDPVGMGLATEAFVEPAGPDCIIPGLRRPIRLLGMQVWPLPFQQNVSLKILDPIGRELKTVGTVLDKAFELMQAPFGDR